MAVSIRRVLYWCNHQKCADCSFPECNHTSDIKYAANFVLDGDEYVEKPMFLNKELNIPQRAKLRRCFVDYKRAWFHQWIEKDVATVKVNAMLTKKSLDRLREKIEAGIISDFGHEVMTQRIVLGIVEYEDGTVAEVEPTSIRFDVEREREE